MMSKEKELDDRLREVGSRLAYPPSAVDELLPLLDQTESLLSRVDQSPTQSMSNALWPSMKALVDKGLLGHLDMDVKVAVASCFSEITRITAPEAPYDDDLMKEIFQSIVQAFENLDDMSSRSYSKRVSVLETVAKVRLCVVMLDLECDTLILEMFHHFLKVIRPYHSEKIFSSMETIMTLVLEESEDISSELILCLLDSVKTDNQNILPVVRRLGEKVISNCSGKLKPYLLEFSQSVGTHLNRYSKAVASICQEHLDGVELNDANASDEIMVDDSKQSERTVSDELVQGSEKMEQEVGCPEEVTSTEKSPKSVMSNGTAQMDNGELAAEPSSPKQKPENFHPDDQSEKAATTNRDVSVNLVSMAVKPDAVSCLKAKEIRVKQTSSVVNLKDSLDHSLKDDSLGKESSGKHDLVSPCGTESGAVKDSLPAQRDIPDATRRKRGRPPKLSSTKHGNSAVAQQSASTLQQKRSEMGNKTLRNKDSDLQKESNGISNQDILEPTIVARVPEENSQSPTSRKDSTRQTDHGDSSLKLGTSKLKQQENFKAKNDIAGEPILKETSLLKSATEAPNQGNLKESGKTKSGRKGEHGVKEISETPTQNKELDGSLIDSRIRVWWPIDKKFYDGVVDSYDLASKKHKVIYSDGDVEILLLKKERWEFVKDDSNIDVDQAKDSTNPDVSSEEPKIKRAKSSSSSITKEINTKTPTKSGTASGSHRKGRPRKAGISNLDDGPRSSSKSNEKATSISKIYSFKSSNKLRGDVKYDGDISKADKSSSTTGSETEDNSLKSSRKSMVGPPTSAVSKSKDNGVAGSKVRKDASKSKLNEDSPLTSQKLKGTITPKAGNESTMNTDSERRKMKSRESETSAKLLLNATPKAPDGESLAGKRRKRKGQT
ncbi:sister chromatid cohesion protein PDS5 homolog C-like isoform X1 [Musa acuminata AAA Group]|uniref:sister chromatid cohesion protein PDS5 homolog C-like isoform X1 n=2 Tax=Musa acuminata AAA Group TaxID=214697 RepID=UPI0031D77495